MAYSLKGDINEQARVIVIDQLGGTLENAYLFSPGEWELITPDNNYKIVLARRNDSGEAYGYSNVTPSTYYLSLAVDSEGTLLAVDDSDTTLAAGV